MIFRAYAEHHEINDLVMSLGSIKEEEDKVQAAIRIADMVDRHVRFEERELFPHLEAAIGESELAKIGEKLLKMQPEPLQDTYADEFWQ